MTDIVNIRPGDIVTILPKSTDVRGEGFDATVRNVVLPDYRTAGGVWTVNGVFYPAVRIEAKDTVDALMAAARAKSAAHDGLAEALEYGTVRALRVDGVDRITADYNGRTYTVILHASIRMASCNGYGVNSTCRDLAYAALTAIRNR